MIGNSRKRWEEIWQKLQARTLPHETFDELIGAYSSPDRFYHNLTHIQDCLSIFDETKLLAIHPEEAELAIWFHDAIYNTKRDDNEQRSAEWAKTVIHQAGIGSEVAERVFHSILATRHTMEVTDRDAQLMTDVDLSILGRDTDIFWRYEENIRKEYAWVPEEVFKQRRIEILSGFLHRQYLYYYKEYRDMFEEKARENLKQAIVKLSN